MHRPSSTTVHAEPAIGPTEPAPMAPTPEQVALWHAAAAGGARATRAAKVAAFSGWTLGVFGVLTALGGLTDPVSLGLAGAMGVLAWSELRGAGQVRTLDPAGPTRLVRNQIGILALIVLYAGTNIARAVLGGPPKGLEPTGDPQVDQILGDVGQLSRTITIGVYATVAAVGVPVQLLMAGYHARRGRQMRAWMEQSPAWALDVVRGGHARAATRRRAA